MELGEPEFSLASIVIVIFVDEEVVICHASYLERQASDIASLRKDEKRSIPANIVYKEVGSLSNEIREKLNHIRPETIAQAQRIEGMTPSAILAILSHMRKRDKAADVAQQASGS